MFFWMRDRKQDQKKQKDRMMMKGEMSCFP